MWLLHRVRDESGLQLIPSSLTDTPMEANHQCPKCRALDVVCVDPYRTYGYTIPIRGVSFAKLMHNVCRQCGYTEESISLPDHIEELVARYGEKSKRPPIGPEGIADAS